MDKRPIGVFDSGVGGLTVVRALSKLLPHENMVYLGDTARVPYGSKSKETVTRFSHECVEFLKRFNVKLTVVACNTASSWSLNSLKKKFKFPVIGVIKPGVKEACRKTRNFKIGVIGTKATVGSASYSKEIQKVNPRIKVYQKACPLFVPVVEENWLNSKITFTIAEEYLRQLRAKRIDTLILGCTHYPLLKTVLKDVFKRGISIIDSSISVSTEVKEFLRHNGIENNSGKKGVVRFYVTDDPWSFENISKFFLKKNVKVNKVNLS